MPSLPLLGPREVVHAFERLGWEVARQRGSHIVLTKQALPQPFRFLITRRSLVGHCER